MSGVSSVRLEYYLDRIREAEAALALETNAEIVKGWKHVAAGYQFLLNRLSVDIPTNPTRI
jgi:hypothetical protein